MSDYRNNTSPRPSGADREHIDEGPNPLGLEGIESPTAHREAETAKAHRG